MKKFLTPKIRVAAVGFLTILLPCFLCGNEMKNPEEQAILLKEISAFDNQVPAEFRDGQRAEFTDKPEPEVKALPAFRSDKPVYGLLCLDRIHGVDNIGIKYYFALDEQGGTGSDYDLLYFDLNHDFDLTNDPPLKPASNPPPGMSFVYDYNRKNIIFDYGRLEFDLKGGKKICLELVPYLIIRNDVIKNLYFISSRLRTGEACIAGKKYTVYLGFKSPIGTAYNYPRTVLYLVPMNPSEITPIWWESNQLKTIRHFGSTRSEGYFQFSATPEGDRLFVKPYTGDFGIFEMGKGERQIDKMEVSGSLASRNAAVAVGGELNDLGLPKPARVCMIPVGDYSPSLLTVNYGRLKVDLSENYHSDGNLMKRGGRPFLESIKIQKDKPFVLDFSNKPEVMFVSPPKNLRVKTGDNFEVGAVLLDPVLDVMIRHLYDTTRKKKTEDGQELDLSLVPELTIARSNGEIVARGNMQFGPSGVSLYTWDVPKNLQIQGNGETFILNVLYDTLELYGKVKGSRELVIYKD